MMKVYQTRLENVKKEMFSLQDRAKKLKVILGILKFFCYSITSHSLDQRIILDTKKYSVTSV